jgi:flagellar basal-body rod modification protein FlgD
VITTAAGVTNSSVMTTSSAARREVFGKDEFLQLLVAQLRHQDPLSPMQPDDLAAQLAQFSSVEQLIVLNERIEQQNASIGELLWGFGNGLAAGVIGRTVMASSDQVWVPEDGSASITVDVAGAGGQAKLVVYDASGQLVESRPLGFLTGGRHVLEIGGGDAPLTPGIYTVAVEVAGDDGQTVAAQTYTTARIDGVRFEREGPVLLAGPLELPLATVVEITNTR